jgi:hypothetical protein
LRESVSLSKFHLANDNLFSCVRYDAPADSIPR